MNDPRVGPAIARQRVHLRLTELRTERDIPAATAAAAMRWSVPKLNRIENGRVTIEPIAVRALLEYYGVSDQDEIDDLMRLSEISRERPWWRESDVSDEFKEFIGYEDEASHLLACNSSGVTGLLQTQDYARSFTTLILGPDDPKVAEIVSVRMRRQESLLGRLNGLNPPRLTHALDEAVLRRRIGGDDVMATQLEHLLELTRLPTVSLTILPLSLHGHPGLGASFELLEFSGDDDGIVFMESHKSDFMVRDREDLQAMRTTMERLVRMGASGPKAVEFIQRARKLIKV